MEINEQITLFDKFFRDHRTILEAANGPAVAVDYKMFVSFHKELARLLLAEPEDTVRAAEIAIEQVCNKHFILRLANVTEVINTTIGLIRAYHIDKMIKLSVSVKAKSDVRPLIVSIKFECPSCGNTMRVLQLDSKIREPNKCGCGRKGSFRKISKEMIDSQKVVISDISGRKIEMLIKADLVDRKLEAGKRYIITGIVKEMPKMVGQSQSTTLDLMIDANNIEDTVK